MKIFKKRNQFPGSVMALSQFRSRRKPTGSMYRDFRKKRLSECGNAPMHTKVGEAKVREKKGRGGNVKRVLLKADTVNVFDSKSGKSQKAKIESVAENPANRNFIRANILTKGTVVKTDKGNVKITNRPGQEGTVNGVLV